MKLGVIVRARSTVELASEFKKAIDMGFETCQLVIWEEQLLTEEFAQKVISAKNETGIDITAFWCGWQKPVTWNFYEGQATLGLIPTAYRHARTQMLLKGSDFAKLIGVNNLVTHVGFMPENPLSEEYSGTIVALKLIVKHCKDNGQNFLFETGQETPITLKRAIQDIGMDNVGINLDPANLLLYGKANPVDSLDVFGEYVMGVHAKDGEYPTDGRSLGQEKPLGEGRVNFPALISKLKQIGYDGPLTIEREISGDKQIEDIIKAKKLLEALI
ncbi:MAG: sugar phosphate isomerase/epimerase [Bacillota bacterium]|nr:sugar phosphate isomerase/epimerase [Bacillota bacterium]